MRVVALTLGVAARRLEARSNDSLDLTICEWHGGPVRLVKVRVNVRGFGDRDARASAVGARAARRQAAARGRLARFAGREREDC